jgi:hypothetical protein
VLRGPRLVDPTRALARELNDHIQGQGARRRMCAGTMRQEPHGSCLTDLPFDRSSEGARFGIASGDNNVHAPCRAGRAPDHRAGPFTPVAVTLVEPTLLRGPLIFAVCFNAGTAQDARADGERISTLAVHLVLAHV